MGLQLTAQNSPPWSPACLQDMAMDRVFIFMPTELLERCPALEVNTWMGYVLGSWLRAQWPQFPWDVWNMEQSPTMEVTGSVLQ